MLNRQLEQCINEKLRTADFHDYAPNGLQVEGRAQVRKILTGVTACQPLLDEAVRRQVDAVIVHHGYFWKNEDPRIIGMKYRRLQTLLRHDINLFAWHLPLDAHPELGNNAGLARLLGITDPQPIEPLLISGVLPASFSGPQLAQHLAQALQRTPLWFGETGPAQIRRVAWCSGGGQSFIERAAAAGVDAFITGEVSEQTIHIARENGLHFYAAGHHATERSGVQALGDWLMREYGLDVTFVDIANPA